MIGCLPTQALAFLAVFVYATQAIAFEWKPGFTFSCGHCKTVFTICFTLHLTNTVRICTTSDPFIAAPRARTVEADTNNDNYRHLHIDRRQWSRLFDPVLRLASVWGPQCSNTKARFPPSELTARVNGQNWRVTGFPFTRQRGPCWRAHGCWRACNGNRSPNSGR